MKRVNWSGIICVLMTAIVGTADAAGTASEPNFPFRIEGNRFVKKSDGKPTFLNIIDYSPMEPGKKPWDEYYPEREHINKYRLKDDLRRLEAFQGGSEPVVLRVYTQPTPREPNRLPKFFYDGVRNLGFWIIRDIYFYGLDVDEGKGKVDAVIAEVNDANAFDIIFAWEIGNEFEAGKEGTKEQIEAFIEEMRAYIKQELNELDINVSSWVTWQSWVRCDPLWTDYEYTTPIEPEGLDYISFNAYSYEPAQIRDHQAGPTTGTPYQGYLAALKGHYSNKPLVIIETGLSDSNLPEADGVHERLHPWYPVYRKGGLRAEQVAEGLADRYWDTRLLRDESDANIIIVGAAIFEWNDEWWKAGGDWEPEVDNQMPEEHFGLGRFVKKSDVDMYQLRYKLQQETVQDLYTLKFRNAPATLEDTAANINILQKGASVKLDTAMSKAMAGPMRYRWEASRGHIVANGASADFYPAENVLGPARITTVSIDGDNYATVTSSKINIKPTEPNSIEILTVGTGVDLSDRRAKASGRVFNVNLDEYKLVCYIYNWHFYIQPYGAMKSIWIGPDGYWCTKISNARNNPGELYCWLVPKRWDPPDEVSDPHWTPPEYIAEANTVNMDPNDYNDVDNDLLRDRWETLYFGNIDANDRYDDRDKDGANNLEEFFAGTSPIDANDPNGNDTDGDGLKDNWERNYFGDINLYSASDDPDGDGLTNLQEQEPNLGKGPDPNFGTHPGRASQDKDRDGLPDVWEIRWFGNCDANPHENPDGDCLGNLDFDNLYEYELGTNPTSHLGNFICDWIVDINDLDAFTTEWLSSDPNYDIFQPKDNLVNFLDYAVFAENWLLEL